MEIMAKQSTLSFAPSPAEDSSRPLADRMRPQDFDDVLGQEHLLAPGTLFREAITRAEKNGHFPSVIFWGAPGCGKTTLARLIAGHCKAEFIQMSAITATTADLRKVFDAARADREAGKRTLLLVDEIHRFNRTQQDLFLPVVEDGTIILIGATTENPSFEINSALLSRCRVLIVNRLSETDLEKLLRKAEEFVGKTLPLDTQARAALAAISDGDGRYCLNLAEALFTLPGGKILTETELLSLVERRRPVYDKSREGHYNLISALHKSLRGSDPDAALYWFARMLDGGEDPLYIARRLIRFASEDIGMADPHALPQILAARDAFEQLGSPEGELALAQGVVYLATAPKSNAAYTAFKSAMRAAKEHGSLMPPKIILNAPTKLMEQEGYGEGYIYDHDTKEGFSGQDYFPESMSRQQFYRPVERGFERDIAKRLEYWDKLRHKAD